MAPSGCSKCQLPYTQPTCGALSPTVRALSLFWMRGHKNKMEIAKVPAPTTLKRAHSNHNLVKVKQPQKHRNYNLANWSPPLGFLRGGGRTGCRVEDSPAEALNDWVQVFPVLLNLSDKFYAGELLTPQRLNIVRISKKPSFRMFGSLPLPTSFWGVGCFNSAVPFLWRS